MGAYYKFWPEVGGGGGGVKTLKSRIYGIYFAFVHLHSLCIGEIKPTSMYNGYILNFITTQ